MRTVFTMGGGGFTADPDDPALDAYVLSLVAERRPRPRVLFLPTASGDAHHQITRFEAAFGGRACDIDVLSMFRVGGRRIVSLRDLVLAQDLIYVGGGSMRNMLAIWREHGLDQALHAAYERGVVLAGLSAGAMCWFAGGVTTSTGVPEPVKGLGFLPGTLSVHKDSEPDRLPVWLDAVRRGELPGGWAADDGVGLLWRGRRIERIGSSRPGRTAEKVWLDPDGGALRREVVEPDLLAAPSPSRSDDGAIEELRALRRRRGG